MLTIYSDPHFVCDITHLVAAVPVDGSHDTDGMYAIQILLHVQDRAVPLCPLYPTAHARNVAFEALGAMVQAWDAAMAAEDEEDA
jgi:hypothetical protein